MPYGSPIYRQVGSMFSRYQWHELNGVKTVPLRSEVTPYNSQYNYRWGTIYYGDDPPFTGTYGWLDTDQLCRLNTSDARYKPALNAYNKAYERWQSKTRPNEVDLGSFLAERRDAFQMITARATQLARAFTFLRRGRFGDFTRVLGVRRRPHHQRLRWSRPRDASSLWLEYWFGWSPLVGDIYSAASVLTSPGPRLKAVGVGRDTYTRVHRDSWGTSHGFEDVTSKVLCRIQAEVWIDNPNLYLLSSMGLTNPAHVLWEVVPFSFVVDWFGTIGRVLDSLDDFYGLGVRNGTTTMHVQTSSSVRRTRDNWTPGVYTVIFDARHVHTRRTIGISRPYVLWKAPDRLALTRAATSIALLVQLFSPRK